MEKTSSINLAELPRELILAHGDSPNYRALYEAVLNGIIPAKKSAGRWYVARADVPKIPKLLARK